MCPTHSKHYRHALLTCASPERLSIFPPSRRPIASPIHLLASKHGIADDILYRSSQARTSKFQSCAKRLNIWHQAFRLGNGLPLLGSSLYEVAICGYGLETAKVFKLSNWPADLCSRWLVGKCCRNIIYICCDTSRISRLNIKIDHDTAALTLQ